MLKLQVKVYLQFWYFLGRKCVISGLITDYKSLTKVSKWMKYVISVYYRILQGPKLS